MNTALTQPMYDVSGIAHDANFQLPVLISEPIYKNIQNVFGNTYYEGVYVLLSALRLKIKDLDGGTQQGVFFRTVNGGVVSMYEARTVWVNDKPRIEIIKKSHVTKRGS